MTVPTASPTRPALGLVIAIYGRSAGSDPRHAMATYGPAPKKYPKAVKRRHRPARPAAECGLEHMGDGKSYSYVRPPVAHKSS